MTAAADMLATPTIEEAVARLARAIDATSHGVLPRIEDMTPALKTLSETQLGMAELRSEEQRKLTEFAALWHKLASCELVDRRERMMQVLDVSKSTYYRQLAEAKATGLIPTDSRDTGTRRESSLLGSKS